MEPLYSSTWAWCSWIIIGTIAGALAAVFVCGAVLWIYNTILMRIMERK